VGVLPEALSGVIVYISLQFPSFYICFDYLSQAIIILHNQYWCESAIRRCFRTTLILFISFFTKKKKKKSDSKTQPKSVLVLKFGRFLNFLVFKCGLD
jgi:hypothetical protein